MPTTANGTSRRLKIMVVDDDAFVREMIGAILGSHGHAVEFAEDGARALERIGAVKDLELIISDMDMPAMSGLELIRHLRASGQQIPIIILTGNNEIRLAIEALKNGANDYLLKNEDIEDTMAISIDNVMEMHRLRMENLRLLEDLARRNRELERLSLLDGLTGVANRRYFDRVIQQEWCRAVRERSPISVVMIDIDFFKNYNDTYGHQRGDVCLQQVASALSAALKRPSDFIARYGGEEFVAVLPDTGLEGARLLSEAMRENVVRLALEHRTSGVGPCVTTSHGVASTAPGRDELNAELIREADVALYAAKQEGRNRTCTTPPGRRS